MDIDFDFWFTLMARARMRRGSCIVKLDEEQQEYKQLDDEEGEEEDEEDDEEHNQKE